MKTRKNRMIVIIVAVLVIALFMIGAKRKAITESAVYDGQRIDQIIVEACDWDVKLGVSADEQIHVEITGEQTSETSLPVKITQEELKLNIVQKKEIRDFISNFTFGTAENIKILVPAGSDYEIEIVTEGGDVYLDGIEEADIAVSTGSGEVITR